MKKHCFPSLLVLSLGLLMAQPACAWFLNKNKIEQIFSGQNNQTEADKNQSGKNQQGQQSHQAGDFDSYMLALSVAPGFCAQNPERAAGKSQCEATQLAADFKQAPLTLHGIWPNNDRGGHPFFCGVPKSAGKFCSMSKVSSLSSEVQKEMQTFMPGTSDCLDRWEWAKHGTCSGLSQNDYFALGLGWTKRVNSAIGAAVLSASGGELDLNALRQNLRSTDPEMAQALQFTCKMPRKQRGSMEAGPSIPALVEVRLALDKAGKSILPLKSNRGQSGCQGNKAFIVAP